MPKFCYFLIGERIVGLVSGRVGYVELGLSGGWEEVMAMNNVLGVNPHDIFAMAICAFFNCWELINELAVFGVGDLTYMLEKLLEKRNAEPDAEVYWNKLEANCV